jgi:hypothetical protein
LIDEIQDRNLRTTHEGAHCAAAHVIGNHPIGEVRVDRPEDGVGGWVWFAPPTGEVSPRIWWQEYAVIMRVGAMITNMDWETDPLCASDRHMVRKIWRDRLSDVPWGAFEMIVESDARELIALPRFDVCHRAICRELLAHVHETMLGEVAHRVMDDALWLSLGPNEDYSLRV